MQSKKRRFTSTLLRWFRAHGRTHLPWREDRDPYAVLVSEIMLQQTQVDRVIPKFQDWMQRFPDAATLAAASPAGVLRAWSGLGYNRRALNLQRAAQEIVHRFDGKVPRASEDLASLPGIGLYTAAAVRVFAFGIPDAAIDVNLLRVLQRYFRPHHSTDQKDAQALMLRMVTPRNAQSLNEALMDHGATICRALPRCAECPLQKSCPSAFRIQPLARIVRQKAPGALEHPRRIYRGRALRAVIQHGSLSLAHLGPHVLPGFTKADHVWLAGIIDDLVAEGMLRRRGTGISLPAKTRASVKS